MLYCSARDTVANHRVVREEPEEVRVESGEASVSCNGIER